MILTDQQWIDHFSSPRIEGRRSHFYQDSNGVITVGIGCAYFSEASASMLPMLRKSDNSAAEVEEIRQEYRLIAGLPKGKTAEFYGVYARLFLPDSDIDRIFLKRFYGIKSQVRDESIDVDTLLPPAQLVTMDIAFNVGPERFRTWTNYLNCLKRNPPDYHGAALESHRLPPVSQGRNDWAKNTLLNLA
jgi:GH24 family phage-related lysozyme (muramidase)